MFGWKFSSTLYLIIIQLSASQKSRHGWTTVEMLVQLLSDISKMPWGWWGKVLPRPNGWVRWSMPRIQTYSSTVRCWEIPFGLVSPGFGNFPKLGPICRLWKLRNSKCGSPPLHQGLINICSSCNWKSAVVPLTAYVRTPVDFPIVSSAIDAGLYIRELYVSADIDSTIYDELREKWMESKKIDRLVVDDFDLDQNLSVLHWR